MYIRFLVPNMAKRPSCSNTCTPDSKNPMKISLHYNLKTLPANAKSGFILFALAFIKDCSESQSRCMSAVFKILIYIDILYLDMQSKIKRQFKKDF